MELVVTAHPSSNRNRELARAMLPYVAMPSEFPFARLLMNLILASVFKAGPLWVIPAMRPAHPRAARCIALGRRACDQLHQCCENVDSILLIIFCITVG